MYYELEQSNIELQNDIKKLSNNIENKDKKIIKALIKIVEKQKQLDLSQSYNEKDIVPYEDLSEHDKKSRDKFKDLESRYLKKAFEEYELIQNNNNNN